MNTILALLKVDLGITHTLRDTYFTGLIDAAKKEIEGKGAAIDLNSVDDQMLVSDYAAWSYRKRQEDVPLARNIKSRINDRVIRKAAKPNA